MVAPQGDDIHVLAPIAIVDEFDRLKEVKDRDVRWRAGYTRAVLDRLFERTTEVAQLSAAGNVPLGSAGSPHGAVTMELLFDPPGHIRLPITDDEITDRALAAQPLAAREIILLTYDTSQSTRARAAGLRVVKLTTPIGDERRRDEVTVREGRPCFSLTLRKRKIGAESVRMRN